MYCSRCNGLLLEGFLQIVMYGKSLQPEGAAVQFPCGRPGGFKNQNNGGSSTSNGVRNEIQDPSVHPWGGLTTTREGSLTLMDCYLYSKSLKGLQIVSGAFVLGSRDTTLFFSLSYSLTFCRTRYLMAHVLGSGKGNCFILMPVVEEAVAG